MKTILALLLLVSSSSFADEWRTEDTYREITYLVLHTMDWAQTRNFSSDQCQYVNNDQRNACVGGNGKSEINPILGKHPSSDQINTYFALTAIAHAGLSYALPKYYRAGFQYMSIGVEVGFVYHNYQLGINARF